MALVGFEGGSKLEVDKCLFLVDFPVSVQITSSSKQFFTDFALVEFLLPVNAVNVFLQIIFSGE